MECCFFVICFVYFKGLFVLNLIFYLNQQQYRFCFILGGIQLKILDVKIVEVKVEFIFFKLGESFNIFVVLIFSNDGKGGFSLLKYMYYQKYVYVCLDVDLDVFIYFLDKDDDGDSFNIFGEKDVIFVGEYLQVFMYNVFRELYDVLVR